MNSIPNYSKNPSTETHHVDQTLVCDPYGVDRISNFPDDILCHILSFLPTETAAATTFLSTRWKPLFASIPNLRLDLSDYSVNESRFPAFMHSVLNLLLRDVKHINGFRLRCGEHYGNANLSAWICYALRFEVGDLALCVEHEDFLSFPISFFRCETLVNLKLDGYFVLEVPNSVCLPSLEYLCLDGVIFGDGDSSRRLFSGCSVLKTLIMEDCEFEDLQVLDISCPLLLVLVVDYLSYGVKYDVVLDTPSLNTLKYHDVVAAEPIKVKNLSRLSVADLRFSVDLVEEDSSRFEQNKAMFVAACSEVRVLCLSGNIMEAIHHYHQLMPTFHNLTKLCIGAIYDEGWEALPHLLENSPGLEVLVFTEGIREYNSFAEFRSRLTDHMPKCFLSHLQEIEFQKVTGEEEEIEVVEYFLKSARVLNQMKMKIDCYLSSEKRIRKKLLKLAKCSTTCKILVT